MPRASDYPEGLGDGHVIEDRGLRRHASPLSLLLLGALLLVAMLGLLGGTKAETIVADGSKARLTVTTPTRLHNGVFFETRVVVTARRPIAKPVVAVDASLWRDLTINSQFPDPKEQGFKDGAFTFDYEPLAAGEMLELKFDGQVNPPLTVGTAGRITLRDGGRSLATVPVEIAVLP